MSRSPSFKCSGRMPHDLKVYRAAQLQCFQVISELGYPLCMGLTKQAQLLVRELQRYLDVMARQQEPKVKRKPR